MRRCVLPGFLLGFLLIGASSADAQSKDPVIWKFHDARELPLIGQAWKDVENPYDRFPARAKPIVRQAVWDLSRHSAGLAVRFCTNATSIQVRWTLTSDRIAMPHMASTGVSGVDLYVLEGDHWKFLAVGRPGERTENSSVLVSGLTSDEKQYQLNLPLYNGVASLEIGVPEGASFSSGLPPVQTQPIVFYGTSITQGGCCSRPGMSYPAILSRRLNHPAINLGFSGNGKAEPEVAALVAEIDAAVFVIDCLPNLQTAQAEKRVPAFIETIRKAHPKTPIVLVENLHYTDSPFIATREAKYQTSNRFLRAYYDAQVAQGDRELYYVAAKDLIGHDGEATVDGIHPTDLGFDRIATALMPALQQSLRKTPRQ